MMCGTRSRKLPRWIGMCSAWQSVSPAALNSAVEQSRRSLMLVECEARISVSPVSSTIEAMAAPITSTVMGSRGLTFLPLRSKGRCRRHTATEGSWATSLPLPLTTPPASRAPPLRGLREGEEARSSSRRHLQDQVQVRVDPGSPADWYERRGVHLFDDRGSREAVARAQRGARMDWRVDEIARFGQPHRPALRDGA